MKQLLIAASTLCMGYGLTACAVKHPSDYEAIERLAEPPRVASQAPAPSEESIYSSVTEDSEAVTANSSTQEPPEDKITSFEGNPPVLKIKQSAKEAWYTVSLALLQLKLRIDDRNHEEGTYLVDYDADNYVEENNTAVQNMLALFNDQYEQGRYKISIKGQKQESEIIIESVPDPEKAAESAESYGNDSGKVGSPEILLKDLYRVLHEDALEDAAKNRKSTKGKGD